MSWATLNAAANRVAFDRLGSVSVTAGAATGRGFLMMPGQIIADGMVINTDYTLTALASDFGGLVYGDGILVNGIGYQVRETRSVDDGTMVEILLSKLAATQSVPGSQIASLGLSDLNDVALSAPAAGDSLTYNGTDWVNTESYSVGQE
jgi:hypothetical protein